MPNENEAEETPEEVIEEEEQTDEEKSEAEYDAVFFDKEDEEKDAPDVSEDDADSDVEPESDSEPSEDEEDEEVTKEDEEEAVAKDDLVTLKWRGKEIKVTPAERDAMAQQNFDITHKYQEVAKMRKSAEADMVLIEKIKGGDKEALAMLAKRGDIDPVDLLDINMDDIEQGTDEPSEPFVSPEVDVLMQEVAKDEPLFNALSDMEKSLPEVVVTQMAKDPETFYAIINEVKSGDAEIVIPQVQARLSMLDSVDRAVVMNNPDAYANFYMNVKQDLISQTVQRESKPSTPKRKVNASAVSVQKSQTSKRGEAKRLDSMQSDEAYERILERLNAQI